MRVRVGEVETGRVLVDGSRAASRLLLDRVVVLVTSLVLCAVTLAAPLFVGISGMRSTGCQGTCDDSLVGAGGAVIIFGCIGVTVAALLGMLLLRRPDRYLWWLPCSALAVAVVVVLLGNHLIDVGVGG